MTRTFIAAVALSISAPLFAQPQDTQAQTKASLPEPEVDLTKFADENAKTDVNKVVCQEQYEIGSRLLHHKVCLTKGQWLEYEAENREHLQQMERLGLSSN